MHLKAMFVFIHSLAHGLEVPCLLQLLYECGVDGKIAERSCICVAAGRGGAGEVVVVRGAEEKDALTMPSHVSGGVKFMKRENVRIRPVCALVGPCSGRPGV